MAVRNQRPVRSAAEKTRGLVLALLLLVPLVASAHHHATETVSPGSCAICVVSHHAPAVVTALPATLALTAVEVVASPPPPTAPTNRVHSPIVGRAPPSSALLSVS